MWRLPMPAYFAYGLAIASDLTLPELPHASAPAQLPADLSIHVARGVEEIATKEPQGDFAVARQVGVLAWPDVGRFWLRLGREVEIEPLLGVSEATLRAFLLGPVLASVLHQRGFLMLHASSVALRDPRGEWGAVGFLGHSGEGKSTITATMHARGHRVVADDYIAVPVADGASGLAELLISPGFARLRLSPQSLQALGQEADALPLLHASQDRRVWPAEESFQASPVPLRRLYALRTGPDLRCEALPPSRAMVPLVQHAYCAGMLPLAESAENFRRCAALACCLPVRELQRPRDLALLHQAAALIEAEHRAL